MLITMIEAGVGFGVPVVRYADKTYFSSSADCEVQKKDSNHVVVWSYCFLAPKEIPAGGSESREEVFLNKMITSTPKPMKSTWMLCQLR